MASVPPPRSPFRCRRRGECPFFDGIGLTFVSGDHINLVALDLAAQDNRRLALNDPFPQLRRHHLGIIGINPQFLGDLLVRQVQPHEIEAQNPDPQRLMMPGEDRPTEVIEPLAAAVAAITLALGQGIIPPVLDHFAGGTLGHFRPSGQRIARMVSKHLASPMWLGRLIIVKSNREVDRSSPANGFYRRRGLAEITIPESRKSLTKYRKKLLQGDVGVRLRQVVRTICANLEVEILKGHVSVDHVHFFVSCPPHASASYLMQRVKGKSSHWLMREFSHLNKACWGRHLWGRYFFVASSGNVTDEVIWSTSGRRRCRRGMMISE